MIRGLRDLPHLQAHKHELRDAGQTSHTYLECSHCTKTVSRQARAQWHCGYLPTSEWTGYGFPAPWPIEPCDACRDQMRREGCANCSTCPGYTTSLPQVAEAARARMWWDKGLLQLRHKKPTDSLLIAIELLHCAAQEAESRLLEKK